jgi:hypothetical protein
MGQGRCRAVRSYPIFHGLLWIIGITLNKNTGTPRYTVIAVHLILRVHATQKWILLTLSVHCLAVHAVLVTQILAATPSGVAPNSMSCDLGLSSFLR